MRRLLHASLSGRARRALGLALALSPASACGTLEIGSYGDDAAATSAASSPPTPFGSSGGGGSVSKGGSTPKGGAGDGGVSDGGADDGGADGSGSGGGGSNPAVVLGIGSSYRHNCALLDDGSVRCWGSDGGLGTLGLARGPLEAIVIGDDETPASAGNVDVGGFAVEIAVGHRHSCAALLDGTVRCWGPNAGILGYADTEPVGDDETPAMRGAVDVASDLETGGKVVQLTASTAHTCALLESGAVRCWGLGENGRLGYANVQTIGDDETPASAGNVELGGSAVRVAAGPAHTCAILAGGALRCWGEGRYGALGYANVQTIGDDESPASAGDVQAGGPVLDVACGEYSTCAVLQGGDVRCWGSPPRHGSDTIYPIGDDETPASAPVVDIGGKAKRITIAGYRVCVVLETGGVRCWGESTHTPLGYGALETIGDNETPADAGDLELGEPASAVSGADLHFCALLESGSVRCWGGGKFGANPLEFVPIGLPGVMEMIGDDEAPADFDPVQIADP